MTSELLIIGIAVGVMLCVLSMVGGILWEHISTEKFQLVLVKLLMLGTEGTFRIVVKPWGYPMIYEWLICG